MTRKQIEIYNRVYACCQAGNMSETDSHEYALDIATRTSEHQPIVPLGYASFNPKTGKTVIRTC